MSRRVTLVTGASSGIGRELALLAAPDSRALVLVARRRERLEELAGRLRESPGAPEVVVLPADLAAEADRRELGAELERRELAVDHLINNAGFGLAGRLHENDPEAERDLVRVNVVALHDLLLRLLPGMVGRGYGRVLNLASTAGYQPVAYMATYGAAKAFVLSLSEALWQEYRGTGVTITCLAPGKTETEFQEVSGVDEVPYGRVPGSSPRAVAEAGYRGMLAGKRVVVPGLQNKAGALAAPRAPKRLVLSLTAKLFEPRAR